MMSGYVAWISIIIWVLFFVFFLNSDDFVQLIEPFLLFGQHLPKASASINYEPDRKNIMVEMGEWGRGLEESWSSG